jgi:hypothetical protein
VIIEYICKYQNTFISSFLFSKNLPEVLNKGVPCSQLFESEVFYYKVDYDEWPSIHTCNVDRNRPYNESLFSLRQHYRTTYPESTFDRLPDQDEMSKTGEQLDSSRILKIDYSVNLLPSICRFIDGDKMHNPEVDIMSILKSSPEIEIFNTEPWIQFIRFKWNTIGF